MLYAPSLAACAFADPPGFRVIRITNTPNDGERVSAINDRGEIVYSRRINQSERGEEIFLYANGQTSRLTEDDVRDAYPDVNSDGVIAWSRFDGPEGRYGPTSEIVRWVGGDIEVLTKNDFDDSTSFVTESGTVLGFQTTGWSCRDSAIHGIRSCDDVVEDVYDDGASNQGPVGLGGAVIWTRYDFCEYPWRSKILRYEDGQIKVLCDGLTPQVVCASPDGAIAWTNKSRLEVWRDEHIEVITSDGRNPKINSRGDIAFIRFNDDRGDWDTLLYCGGEFRDIAVDSNWNIADDMNERGDIVVRTGNPGEDYDVYLYQRLPDGDMNCDEKVDFDDIDGFVEAITDRAVYEKNNKTCDWWLADCNGDRKIDFNDIDAFIDCLINNGCP